MGSSFLEELGRIADQPDAFPHWPWLRSAVVYASPAVLDNTTYRSTGLVIDRMTATPLRQMLRRPPARPFDASLTLFGPEYGRRRAHLQIVGFADVTSLFPEFSAINSMRGRGKHFLRRSLSKRAFSRADQVIVEAHHVALALTDRWQIKPERLNVVPNVLHSVFNAPDSHEQVHLPPTNTLRLCYPTRLYPHKNLNILGQVRSRLLQNHNIDVQFVLTLSEAEWQHLDDDVQAASISTGPLRITQLPSLYAQCDGVIFPSLNECFSVTPLEALASGSPLFASDRDFVSELTRDSASYFDPLDAESIARTVASSFQDRELMHTRKTAGVAIASSWPNARDRAIRYLQLIQDGLEST